MRFGTWSCVALAITLWAATARADDADAGAELAAPAAAEAPPIPYDGGTGDPLATSLRSTLMGADPVYMRAGLLAPPRGSFSVGLDGLGQIGCERFSARPDRRPIQVVADDGSGLYDACYRLGQLTLAGEYGLGRRLGAFFSFVPLAITTESGGPVSRSAAGVSDLTAGFRLQVFDDELQGAMVVAAGVPIGRSTSTPPLGSGDFRADFMSYLSKLFERVPIMIAMGMGMRLRGWAEVNEVSKTTTVVHYSNELRYELRVGYAFEVGRSWLPAVLVAVTSDGRWSLDPGVEDGLGILNSPTGTALLVGLEVVARFGHGFRATVTGGQLVIGHSVPIFTYFGAGVGIAR